MLLLFYAVTNSKPGLELSFKFFSRGEERGLPNKIDGKIIENFDR